MTVPRIVKITQTGPGSIMTELTVDPADNDIAYYGVFVADKKCTIPVGTVPTRCEITGLEEGKNHYVVARECYSDDVCGYGGYQYVDTLPKGTFLNLSYPSSLERFNNAKFPL